VLNDQRLLIKPTVEIQPSDPNLWEKEEQDSLLGFFKLLTEIDVRNNPENYKLQFQPNSNIYEPNNRVQNTTYSD
jgi:hypothetical protein